MFSLPLAVTREAQGNSWAIKKRYRNRKRRALKLWVVGFGCAIGLTLGLYFLGAGLYDLCYGIGPFRPTACASGPLLEEQDSFLALMGVLLVLTSLTVSVSIVLRRHSASNKWVIWFVRSVLAVGVCSGILIFLSSSSGICDPFGPLGTTGTFCTSFDAYEVIGPVLALISAIGLACYLRGVNAVCRVIVT